ncbi:hypothetical protein NEOLEDRAFT_610133 [Neolentinus lepideus HHB14362 ss-1]|uniref:Secreted protein n=1 Tax=Neolentinus lepideus HHB14362 ss-1 TaxID=1314782 RepID=A0A165VER1_9AGAM|nr:hypothetical protein NEOLEDRAFT_610133 [Neolentinus lepideus HHB14362 ss-1]
MRLFLIRVILSVWTFRTRVSIGIASTLLRNFLLHPFRCFYLFRRMSKFGFCFPTSRVPSRMPTSRICLHRRAR